MAGYWAGPTGIALECSDRCCSTLPAPPLDVVILSALTTCYASPQQRRPAPAPTGWTRPGYLVPVWPPCKPSTRPCAPASQTVPCSAPRRYPRPPETCPRSGKLVTGCTSPPPAQTCSDGTKSPSTSTPPE